MIVYFETEGLCKRRHFFLTEGAEHSTSIAALISNLWSTSCSPSSPQHRAADHLKFSNLSCLRLVTDGGAYVEPSCRLAPALAAAARCCSCCKSRLTDQSNSAQRRIAGRAARSGAVHSAASAMTFSTAATTALLRRIRGSITTTAKPSLHLRSACTSTVISSNTSRAVHFSIRSAGFVWVCLLYPFGGEALVAPAPAATLDRASAGDELDEKDAEGVDVAGR